MTRRTPLPGAAELFRPTSPSRPSDDPADNGLADNGFADNGFADNGFADNGFADPNRSAPSHRAPAAPPRRGSPRQKHTSKITVYVSDEELLALERARLALRATHSLAVDRGRVVREAVAVVLADLLENGENSVLVRRLRQDTDR